MKQCSFSIPSIAGDLRHGGLHSGAPGEDGVPLLSDTRLSFHLQVWSWLSRQGPVSPPALSTGDQPWLCVITVPTHLCSELTSLSLLLPLPPPPSAEKCLFTAHLMLSLSPSPSPPPQQTSKHTLEEAEKCLFTTHLMLETNYLCFEPPETKFHSTITDILAWFQDCTRAVPNLIPDPFFHSFTRLVSLHAHYLHTHTEVYIYSVHNYIGESIVSC